MQDYFNVEWVNKDGEKQNTKIIYNSVLEIYLKYVERIGGKISSVVSIRE